MPPSQLLLRHLPKGTHPSGATFMDTHQISYHTSNIRHLSMNDCNDVRMDVLTSYIGVMASVHHMSNKFRLNYLHLLPLRPPKLAAATTPGPPTFPRLYRLCISRRRNLIPPAWEHAAFVLPLTASLTLLSVQRRLVVALISFFC